MPDETVTETPTPTPTPTADAHADGDARPTDTHADGDADPTPTPTPTPTPAPVAVVTASATPTPVPVTIAPAATPTWGRRYAIGDPGSFLGTKFGPNGTATGTGGSRSVTVARGDAEAREPRLRDHPAGRQVRPLVPGRPLGRRASPNPFSSFRERTRARPLRLRPRRGPPVPPAAAMEKAKYPRSHLYSWGRSHPHRDP